MKKVITLLALVLCSFQNFTVNAQTDTCFWFAVPWTTPDHTFRDPLKLHIAGEPSTSVRVRQPAALFPNQYDTTFVIPPSGLFDYTFWRDDAASPTNRGYDSLEARPANTVLPYGLKVTASSNITVVYDQITRAPNFLNPETFSLKGQNALGTNFICPQQNTWVNQTLGGDLNGDGIVTQPKQQINIVATMPNTVVWIRPKCNIVGHLAGTTYSIMMNTGDVYTLENVTQATSTVTPGQNLGGTLITSNNPIAVTIADDSVRTPGGGCYDLIGDQIVPVESVGTEYIANKGQMYPASAESIFMMGTDTLTSVTVNDGAITTYTMNKGVIKQHLTGNPLTYIVATKNIYVIQTTGYGCESGEAILPPINCKGSDSVVFTRNNNQPFFLNIVTKTPNIGNFSINGTATLVPASAFTVVPGTAGVWSGAQINFSTAQIPVNTANTIKNSSGDFALGIFNGNLSTGGLFHYMSNFPANIQATAVPDFSFCVGSSPTITISGTVKGGNSTGLWSTTNGTGTFGTYSSFTNTITTTYSLSPADYSLPQLTFVLASAGSCLPVNDTLVVTLNPLPSVNVSITSSPTVCVGSGPVTLTGVPSGGIYSGTNVSGNIFTPSSAGNFSPNYSYTDSNGCTNNDTVGIFVSLCTNLENQSSNSNSIKVFPNPFKNSIQITNPGGKNVKLTMFDVTGKIIISDILFDHNYYNLNTEKINCGLYYLKIESDNKQQFIKVVKVN